MHQSTRTEHAKYYASVYTPFTNVPLTADTQTQQLYIKCQNNILDSNSGPKNLDSDSDSRSY